MRKDWSDSDVKRMRELRSMGASKVELCLQFKISGGHLDRILNGTARISAGGPLSGGQVLRDERMDGERIFDMTPEEQVKLIEEGREKAGVRMPDFGLPKEDPSELAQSYGARTRAQLMAERFGRRPKDKPVFDVAISPSGIPIEPELMKLYGEQNEVKGPDADGLLDDLMKE
jgi:hypothetical protein